MSRGYHFTAPCDFTICGLFVADDASTGLQSVEVVRFTAGAPPAYSATTNSFVSLFYQALYPTNTMIPCDIQVNTGDIIGVYGCRQPSSINSYGQAQCPTTIMGFPVTLERSGMQFDLSTQQMHDIWSEVNYYVGRIFMYINCCPTPDFTIDSVICLGDTATANYIGSGVPPAASFSWDFGGGIPATANTIGPHDVTWATTGIKTVTLDVSQVQCPTVSDTQTVSVIALPVANAGTNDTICNGESTTLIASGGTNYIWSNGTTTASNTVSPTTTTTYTVTVDNGGGCSNTASVDVIVNPLPTITVTDPIICDGETATITASGGVNYLWDNSMTGSNINVTPSSTTTYTVTGTDVNGCTGTATATVTVNPNPTVTITSIPDTCNANVGTATASPSGGLAPYFYEWSTAPPQTTNPAVNLAANTYTVTVTDDNGCTGTADITISNETGFTLSSTSNDEHCEQMDGSANVIASGANLPLTYTWSHDPGLNSPTATGLSAGTYTVTVEDGYCLQTIDITVNAIPGPTAGFTVNPTQADIENALFTISDMSVGATSWLYYFGDGNSSTMQNPINEYTSEGQYTIIQYVFDNEGCEDSASVEVIVEGLFTFYIPNAFSPNGDNRNDYFLPKGIGIDANTWNMRIYDRWGRTVFVSTDINQPWDGEYFLEDVDKTPTTVFGYYISFKTETGLLKEYYGHVTTLP